MFLKLQCRDRVHNFVHACVYIDSCIHRIVIAFYSHSFISFKTIFMGLVYYCSRYPFKYWYATCATTPHHTILHHRIHFQMYSRPQSKFVEFEKTVSMRMCVFVFHPFPLSAKHRFGSFHVCVHLLRILHCFVLCRLVSF